MMAEDTLCHHNLGFDWRCPLKWCRLIGLPRIPRWLRDDLAVPLKLESTHAETCGDLRA